MMTMEMVRWTTVGVVVLLMGFEGRVEFLGDMSSLVNWVVKENQKQKSFSRRKSLESFCTDHVFWLLTRTII